MKGSYKAGRSMEFSVAAWDNIWHAEREQRVHIVVQALPANQRGVFVFDIKAVALEDTPDAHPLARVTDTWPNSHEAPRSEEHTSELQSHVNLVCRLLLEKKKKKKKNITSQRK